MSKTPSRKLYDLIKSLTGSEKRYFKLFAHKPNAEKNNKYLRLFKAIDAQKEFDDEKLQDYVYEGARIQSRKYSELKSYLYDLVLKALQNFDEKSSIDYRLKGILQSIRVLYKRGHYNDCKELLQKAKKLAYKYEMFTCILEISNWEKKIAYTLIDTAYLNKELERIDEEEKQCLLQLQNLSAYRNLFFEVLIMLKTVPFNSIEAFREHLTEFVKTPLLSTKDAIKSHHAELLYYRIYSLSYLIWGAYESFHEYADFLVKKMESKPFLLKEDVSEYISAMSNYIMSCKLVKAYSKWDEALNKLLTINANTIDDEIKIHRQYYQGKLAFCITVGDFEQGRKALETHFEKIDKYDKSVFEKSAFYFSYFYIYFGVGDYDKALEYLNEWLNAPKSIERQDMQMYARILNLIVHYEIGNTLLLESLLRSTYRYLRKMDNLRPIDRKILNFIKNSTKVYSKKEMQEYYLELQNDLKNMPNDGKRKIGSFDLAAWLESKLTKKTLAEIIQEKMNIAS